MIGLRHRVAEPHHNGTVHWHLLCFMCNKVRRMLNTLLRKFAIREDRAELSNNTGLRFKSELINPRKGTPTSYIAKYISKNIDGFGLAKEISKEPTNRCATAPSTSVPGHRCTEFSSSVSSVFLGVRRTAGCACWRAGRESAGR